MSHTSDETVSTDHEPTYYHDPGGHKRRARETRIEELMASAREQGGVADRLYWAMVYDFEEAPQTTDARELDATGFDLPLSSDLDDDALAVKLAALIEELDRMGTIVMHYDRIEKRRLYELLTQRLIHHERGDTPLDPGGGGWVLDIDCICGDGELSDLDDDDWRDGG